MERLITLLIFAILSLVLEVRQSAEVDLEQQPQPPPITSRQKRQQHPLSKAWQETIPGVPPFWEKYQSGPYGVSQLFTPYAY